MAKYKTKSFASSTGAQMYAKPYGCLHSVFLGNEQECIEDGHVYDKPAVRMLIEALESVVFAMATKSPRVFGDTITTVNHAEFTITRSRGASAMLLHLYGSPVKWSFGIKPTRELIGFLREEVLYCMDD